MFVYPILICIFIVSALFFKDIVSYCCKIVQNVHTSFHLQTSLGKNIFKKIYFMLCS